MGPDLQTAMTPVVSRSLSGVKAFQALDRFTAKNSLIAGQFGARDLTGYVTEKALSVDNLFVFVIIMASFGVPRERNMVVQRFFSVTRT